jgi:hypothetical protein
MTRRLEAGLKRLAAEHFDGVGLDAIPRGEATARNIGRGKLNNGRKAVRPIGG